MSIFVWCIFECCLHGHIYEYDKPFTLINNQAYCVFSLSLRRKKNQLMVKILFDFQEFIFPYNQLYGNLYDLIDGMANEHSICVYVYQHVSETFCVPWEMCPRAEMSVQRHCMGRTCCRGFIWCCQNALGSVLQEILLVFFFKKKFFLMF